MHYRAKFHQNRSRLQRYCDLTFFFKMAAVRNLGIVGAPIGTTLDDHLMVCIVV